MAVQNIITGDKYNLAIVRTETKMRIIRNIVIRNTEYDDLGIEIGYIGWHRAEFVRDNNTGFSAKIGLTPAKETITSVILGKLFDNTFNDKKPEEIDAKLEDIYNTLGALVATREIAAVKGRRQCATFEYVGNYLKTRV